MHVVVSPIDARGVTLRVERDGVALSWAEVARGLVTTPELRAALSEALINTGFAAAYWEARSLAPGDEGRAFECVVLEARGLASARADVTSFVHPLAGARAPAVRRFANLSGDAELVVPAPGGGAEYPHLLAFLRTAPAVQVHGLWAEVGIGVEAWLLGRGTRLWVSTAGDGVPWLHVRLDSRPKYFKWRAYREGAG